VSSGAARAEEDPPGFVLWKAERIAQTIERLDRELGDRSMVYETFVNAEGHSVYLVLRGKTGTVEFHETEADLYVVRRGHATLILGGELVEPKRLRRKQQTASSIQGGIEKELGPGDVVHIPEGVPHQLRIAEGQSFLYDLTKFDEEPLEPR